MNSRPAKTIRIGICGLGTVGGGTLQLLLDNHQEISRRLGAELKVVHIASRSDKPRVKELGIRFSNDVMAVANDPDVDVVVEALGGFDPALKLVLQAISNGKHVVTANKALIAIHGNEIFAQAKKHAVIVAFESAVAGGIPIIKSLREGLAANSIQWLAGIINGTSNFILSEMAARQRSFDDVLKEAQQRGYAEADPTFDVEGIDAAHKLTILAAIAFGISLQFDKVYTEGISNVSIEDIRFAQELGYNIKHLGIARCNERGVEMRVHPTLISRKRLIANVHGVMNAVLVKGRPVGATLYYGAGAGAGATASSVVADIMDITRQRFLNSDANSAGIPFLAFNEQRSDLSVLTIEQIETAYYLRITALDKVGVMAKISTVLQNHQINIEAVIQKEPEYHGAPEVPVVLLTDRIVEQRMNEAIKALEALDEISGKVVRIRLEELDGEES